MIPHSKPTIENADKERIGGCLATNLISRNNLSASFETRLTQYLDTPYARVVSSGTTALVLALKAIGISKPEQEVLLPTYVCRSVAEAVIAAGGKPVYYDNDLLWTTSAKQVQQKITAQTAAIIVVHIMGMPVKDIEAIVGLGIPVIEDVCQAFGAEWNGKKLGNFGEIGMYSFHSTKCLTTGEGGAITSSNAQTAKKIEEIFQQEPSLFPFTDMQAALGLAQLDRYDSFLKKREEIANIY